jgi:hypothetical protein
MKEKTKSGSSGKSGENLGGSGETISTLTDGDVEDELLNLNLPHWIRKFLLGSLRFSSFKFITKMKKKIEMFELTE